MCLYVLLALTSDPPNFQIFLSRAARAIQEQPFINIYNKVNKLVLSGSVYKRSDKQIQTVQKRYAEAVNGKSITNDSIKRWFSENYLNNNPQVYNFFYNLLEKKKR